MKSMYLGYILVVKLAGQVEILNGEGRGKNGRNERKKNTDN